MAANQNGEGVAILVLHADHQFLVAFIALIAPAAVATTPLASQIAAKPLTPRAPRTPIARHFIPAHETVGVGIQGLQAHQSRRKLGQRQAAVGVGVEALEEALLAQTADRGGNGVELLFGELTVGIGVGRVEHALAPRSGPLAPFCPTSAPTFPVAREDRAQVRSGELVRAHQSVFVGICGVEALLGVGAEFVQIDAVVSLFRVCAVCRYGYPAGAAAAYGQDSCEGQGREQAMVLHGKSPCVVSSIVPYGAWKIFRRGRAGAAHAVAHIVGSLPHLASMSHVTTVVGNGVAGRAPEGAIGAGAAIQEPFGVALGPDGALYFCDLGNHRICRVDLATRRLSVVAGTSVPGNSGDGGSALHAEMREPYEIGFDAAGNLYCVDMPNHVIRRIDATSGRIETVAGTGEAGYSGDGGAAKEATFRQPHSIAIAADGAIFVADIGNHCIRRIDAGTGAIETFAGTGEAGPTVDGAVVSCTTLNGPRALAFDERGDMVLTLREGNAVQRIEMATGTIRHVAGTGKPGYSGDGGDAHAADLAGPKGISVNRAAIYIADTESHTIRRIDRRTGVISTVVGNGRRFDGEDGDPKLCGLARPHGVCATADGRLFIGDSDNHRIRALATAAVANAVD